LKEKVKNIENALEKMLDEYIHNIDGGKHKMTPEDAPAIAGILQGLTFAKALCLIADVGEHGLNKVIEKITGKGDGQDKQQDYGIGFGRTPGQPQWIEQFKKYMPGMAADYDDLYNRRGVPGTGRGIRRSVRSDFDDSDYTYDDINYYDIDDIEMRRGGRRKRDSKGRFIHSDMDTMDDLRAAEHRSATAEHRAAIAEGRIAGAYPIIPPVMPHTDYTRNETHENNLTSPRKKGVPGSDKIYHEISDDRDDIGPGSMRR